MAGPVIGSATKTGRRRMSLDLRTGMRPSAARRVRLPGFYQITTTMMPQPPSLIALRAVLVAVRIGVSTPPTAYAVFPSGVIAMPRGWSWPLTLTALSAVLVAVRIGTTLAYW
jgi:hypothetical protein